MPRPMNVLGEEQRPYLVIFVVDYLFDGFEESGRKTIAVYNVTFYRHTRTFFWTYVSAVAMLCRNNALPC
jgi:hypothetical protein